jgi:hypothetical protein
MKIKKKETLTYYKVFGIFCLPMLYEICLLFYVEREVWFFIFPLILLGLIILYVGFKFIYNLFYGKYV